jgi:hypothetical protein
LQVSAQHARVKQLSNALIEGRLLAWCYNTQHNSIQHNNTEHYHIQYNGRYNATLSIMTEHRYAERGDCNLMLSVTIKLRILSVILLNVVMLSALQPLALPTNIRLGWKGLSGTNQEKEQGLVRLTFVKIACFALRDKYFLKY